MMRFTLAKSVALAGLLVVPAITSQSGPGGGVAKALGDTVAALEELAGLRSRVASGDASAVEDILAATEPAILGPRVRDEFLVTLREEVSGLRMLADELALDPTVGTTRPDGPAPDSSGKPELLGPPPDRAAGVPTVGIDDSIRQAIRSYPMPLTELSPRATLEPGVRALEPEGFTADVVRQGRLFYRAERYAEALTVLEASDDPDAAYWLARCLERLDRTDEAIEALQALIADERASTLADRARRDLDFLTWKRNFQERKSRGGGK